MINVSISLEAQLELSQAPYTENYSQKNLRPIPHVNRTARVAGTFLCADRSTIQNSFGFTTTRSTMAISKSAGISLNQR